MYIQAHYYTVLKEVPINKVPSILSSLHFEKSKNLKIFLKEKIVSLDLF